MDSTRTHHSPTPPATLQYLLLALVAFLSFAHVLRGTLVSYQNLVHGTEISIPPVYSGARSRIIPVTPTQAAAARVPPAFVLLTTTYITAPAKQAGLAIGDAIYTVDGKPYTGYSVMADAVARHPPGSALDLTFWRAGNPLDSPPAHALVRLTPQRIVRPPLWGAALQTLFTVLPVFCLLTGFYVVLARPRSTFAWMILGILGYLSAFLMQTSQQSGPFLSISILWGSLGQTAMPLCFMLFGIYFPTRAKLDRRFPWIKWLVLAPILALLPLDIFTSFATIFRYSALAVVYSILTPINNFENIVSAIAIFFAFYCLGAKIGAPGTSPDANRRLRLLIIGCSVGLLPLFFLLVYSIARGGGSVSEYSPQWVNLSVFALLLIFPITLAYVVIVQRAMELRIIVRQGTKYFFAKQSIFILGVLLATWMAVNLSRFFASREHRVVDVVRILGIVAWFFVFRTIGAKKMQRRIDQKFFREAYSTEQILSELSDEARNFTEIAPLIETITRRLSETLHIDRTAVFLRTGDIFQLEYTTGLPLSPGYIPSLPAASTTITNLTRGKSAPANVYRDDPSSWLVDATDAERTALADLSTELLVPLPGRNRLVGVIALGPKSSEEPYTKSDRQLLQSVASQTGLALENAELLRSLTAELAQRASIQREIEIAREVQERLFPQTYPHIPGIDLCGFCRPAQFVGGDYYDFFLIPQPSGGNRLAIAIGDISGKGISAALLMASLRASLRSVATIQPPKGSGNTHLATLIGHVNRLVFEASTSNRYATFFYAELDPATRLLTYVNAGHNCPAILRTGQPALQLQPTGTVIGLLEDAAYEQATVQLHPGDTLLAFTDGISEAMTADDEEWGEDRMTAAAQRLLAEPTCTRTAAQLLQCILAEADTFTAGAPQHDDMTLLLCTLAAA